MAIRAMKKDGAEADELFKEAGERYAEAVKIKSDDANIFYSWGSMLDTWARRKAGEEADELFEQADAKYVEAVKIKSDDLNMFNDWGSMLGAWARTKDEAEADELFNQADEKYAEVVKIKMDDAGIYNSWGIILLWWYRVISDDRKRTLMIRARDILLQAEKIEEGCGAYNLACASSLLGDDTECLRWLELSKKVGHLPKREHLESDKDLDPVREKQWFKDFLVTLE